MDEAEDDALRLDAIRLDIWLWRARFYKTRSLSSKEITKRGVRITRAGKTLRASKPSLTIRVGDIVTFGKSVHIRTVEVLALGSRRGPASEGAALYAEIVEDT